MSNAIVQALEDAARKVVTAVEDAARSAGHFVEDTGTRLRAAARDLTEHDGNAAAELQRAGKHGDETPTIHGGGSSITRPSSSSPGSGLTSELADATDLPNPTERLSAADHPYLRPALPTEREAEAIRGVMPDTKAHIEGDAGGRTLPPDHVMTTFQGPVRPFTLEPGTTYYRSVGDGSYPNGSFWSEHPPDGETELRSGYAVKNSWNGDHGVVAFTPSQPVHVWEGEVAPQLATGDTSSYLPGGARQIWVEPKTLGADDGHWAIAPAPEKRP